MKVYCLNVTVAKATTGEGSKMTLAVLNWAMVKLVGMFWMCLPYVSLAMRIVLESLITIAAALGLGVLVVMLAALL